MTKKVLLKKIFLYGLLPFIIISIAMVVFGREPVNKFLMYSTPVMILPLILKIFKTIYDKKKANKPS